MHHDIITKNLMLVILVISRRVKNFADRMVSTL